MRLIDADFLDNVVIVMGRASGRTFLIRALKDIINAAPTVEAIPVEWIHEYGENNWLDYGTEYNAITCMLDEWRHNKDE